MTHDKPAYHTLVVDDELDICFLLKSILKRKDTTVACANTIDQAKTELNRQQPDILFLDNYLPDGIGMDLICYVKDKFPLTKIIMISAQDSAANQRRAIQSGAQKFLPKPFMVDELDNTLHDLYD
jgi:two-component system OmpR family response regulator